MIPALKNDQSLQESIPQGLLDQKYEHILFIRKATVNDKEEIVLASEYSLYFFTSKTFSKQLQVRLSFTWDKIKSINLPDSSTIILTYIEKELKILHKDAVQMFYSILLHLKSIFIPSEMPQVEINVKQPTGITPNSSPMLSRYIYLARKNNIEIAANALTALKEGSVLVRKSEEKHKQIELDLSLFPGIQNQMYIYLKTAEIEPSIQKIIIPKTGKPKPWTSLVPHFQSNDTVDGVICKEIISEDFIEVVEAISNNSKSKINSFTFQDTSFTEDSLISIINLIKIKNIDSISILSSIEAPQFEKLAPHFADQSIKLSSLNNY
ncbi:hypothetical protein TVAG_118590 [Trichomonas vaginalis G3]|uniref:Uncharacterized protein n=1 Tax=Trichomonas vaginalis (strain ATCC PRA-98 / G3) TaxID=412133 RepID=A2EAW2_TRIV3|nr:hypothetical protein TVAGG3_0773560 [Trichomonas vaginalis G3]EAY10207.1 hypothetical protein TVAG_118590 [Trichomonas vaginalis G3]KAI5513991.1 hypothetical protein TVAGG3_0773560 [Trichomonas vaginalis G3]|eukprot:XP_001322430.1 hypothetical protein [Trichomonas vaginalis G3]